MQDLEDELENDRIYNEGVFDMDAIKKIELKNIKQINPYRKEVEDVENLEKQKTELSQTKIELPPKRGQR
jgi:hypothetical protein